MDLDDFGICNKSATTSASIAPLCHRLCSDKVKDRQDSMSQIKNILSDGQRSITESTSSLLIKSLMKYLKCELKHHFQNAVSCGKALRDWRWGIGIISAKYPSIYLTDLVSDVFICLKECVEVAPNQQNIIIHETLLILGRHLLCKPAYLQKIKDVQLDIFMTYLSNFMQHCITNQNESNDILRVIGYLLKYEATCKFLNVNNIEKLLRFSFTLLDNNLKQVGNDFSSSSDFFNGLIALKDYIDNFSDSISLSQFHSLAPIYALSIRNLNCFEEIVFFCHRSVINESVLWKQLIERENLKPKLPNLCPNTFSPSVKILLEIGSKIYSKEEVLLLAKTNKYFAAILYLTREISISQELILQVKSNEALVWWVKKIEKEVGDEELFELWNLDYFYSLLFKKNVWTVVCSILQRMMNYGHFGLFSFKFYEKFIAFASINDSVESLEIVKLLNTYIKTQSFWRKGWDCKFEEEISYIKQWITNILLENTNNASIFKYINQEIISIIDFRLLVAESSLLADVFNVIFSPFSDKTVFFQEINDPQSVLEIFNIAYEKRLVTSPEGFIQFLVRWLKEYNMGKSIGLPFKILDDEFEEGLPNQNLLKKEENSFILNICNLIMQASNFCNERQFSNDACLFVEKHVTELLISDATLVVKFVELFDIKDGSPLEGILIERMHHFLNNRICMNDPQSLLIVSSTIHSLIKKQGSRILRKETFWMMIQYLINKAISRKFVFPFQLYKELLDMDCEFMDKDLLNLFLNCGYLDTACKYIPGLWETLEICHLLRYLLTIKDKMECVKILSSNITRRIPSIEVFDNRDVQKFCALYNIYPSQFEALFGLGTEIGWWPGKFTNMLDESQLQIHSEDYKVQALLVLKKKIRPRNFNLDLITAVLLNSLEFGGDAIHATLKGKCNNLQGDSLNLLVKLLQCSQTPFMNDYLACALPIYEQLFGEI